MKRQIVMLAYSRRRGHAVLFRATGESIRIHQEAEELGRKERHKTLFIVSMKQNGCGRVSRFKIG